MHNITISVNQTIDDFIREINFYRKYIKDSSIGINPGYSGCSCCGSDAEFYITGQLPKGISFDFLRELYILLNKPLQSEYKSNVIKRLKTLKKYQNENIKKILKEENLL